MNGGVVGDDEKVNGSEVVFGVLREQVSVAHQAAQARSQGAKPASDMAGLAFVLAAAMVGARWERGGWRMAACFRQLHAISLIVLAHRFTNPAGSKIVPQDGTPHEVSSTHFGEGFILHIHLVKDAAASSDI